MKSSVAPVTALPKLLSLLNRNNALNERAYQRALARGKSQSPQVSPLYAVLEFKPSDDISLQHMMKEKSSRQRIVDMQHQLNEFSAEQSELMMH